MMTNSKYVFSVFHPEYLVDLLRAGGRFPYCQTFSLPAVGSSDREIKNVIAEKFPALSEERHEIWVKFNSDENNSHSCFSIVDIESAHFYNIHRHEATSRNVLHTLGIYGIPVGEPMNVLISDIMKEYDSDVREQTAKTIVKAWYPEINIPREFIEQLRIGYVHQQSPSPEKLPPLPSNYIWAHMVAYNPGIRKFDERPKVLMLQDIQEVLKGTDAEFKIELKSIGDKYGKKFSDLLDDAENSMGPGLGLSKWLIQNREKANTYLFDLENFLSGAAKQQSFFYSSLLYMYWREEILNKDYQGYLGECKAFGYYVNNKYDNKLSQASAEALFTIVYAGGSRIFQKALIEARMKILAPNKIKQIQTKEKGQTIVDIIPIDTPLFRFFRVAKKEFGKFFKKFLEDGSKEKKKKILEALGLQITKIAKGDFEYDQFIKLCSLLEFQPEKFALEAGKIIIVQIIDNQMESGEPPEVDEYKGINSSELIDQKQLVENVVSDDKQTEEVSVIQTKNTLNEAEHEAEVIVSKPLQENSLNEMDDQNKTDVIVIGGADMAEELISDGEKTVGVQIAQITDDQNEPEETTEINEIVDPNNLAGEGKNHAEIVVAESIINKPSIEIDLNEQFPKTADAVAPTKAKRKTKTSRQQILFPSNENPEIQGSDGNNLS